MCSARNPACSLQRPRAISSQETPCLGLAYSPSARAGLLKRLVGEPGRTSIRASFGVFYSAIEGAQTFYTDPAAPYLVFYTSPLPALFESPLTNRTDGGINPIPIP